MNNSQLLLWNRHIGSAYCDDEWKAGRLKLGKQSTEEDAEQILDRKSVV